ncbi:hypothetical protein C8J57DRAFT_1231110 [Mycena rebaudengoi]|nr:hypothetical protein C8J57DRAFT_1231110 [Mycena rebaudengoi]
MACYETSILNSHFKGSVPPLPHTFINVTRTKFTPTSATRKRCHLEEEDDVLATNTRRTCAHAAACPPWHGLHAFALDSPASERAAARTCAHLRDACRARAWAAVIAWRRVGGRAVRASVAWAGVLEISRLHHRRCGSQEEETVSRWQRDISALGRGSRVGKAASRARRGGREEGELWWLIALTPRKRAEGVEGIGVERQWWVNARWRCAASVASDEDGGRKREFEMRSELESAANLAAIKLPDRDCDLRRKVKSATRDPTNTREMMRCKPQCKVSIQRTPLNCDI